MRLTDLNPQWIGNGGEGVTNAKTGEPVPYRPNTHLGFNCPCGDDNCQVIIQIENPLDGKGALSEAAVSWKRTGETFDELTLHPSILRTDPKGCCWHGFIREGIIVEC